MIFRLLLPLFIAVSLFGADDAWYSKIGTKLEVGLYLPTSSGTISNLTSKSNFQDDFGYSDAKATYAALSLTHDYNYIPNLRLSYFNMQDNKSVTLSKIVKVADGTFDANSSVASVIDYQVFSAILYQDLKLKGKMFSLFGKPFYSGDLEFDLGLNAKITRWNYQVQDLTNLSKTPSWIRVSEFIPLPYIGMRYYLYDLVLSADASALAFSRAQSATYQASVDYRAVKGLHLSAGYIYEEFKVLEKEDTVDFKTAGYKFSFKYTF